MSENSSATATQNVTPLFANAPGLEIGAMQVPTRVFMAPMMGYNEPPLRRIHRRFGSGLCITEMIKPEEMVNPSKTLLQELALEAEEHPVSAQISAREPEPALHASLQLRALGFDAIDLNFGCPNKKECNRGRGAAMMKDPELIGKLVEFLVANLDCPITVKMRSGWSCEDPTAPAAARAAADAGAAAICLHGRSKIGWYHTENNLDVIAETRAAVPDVPFIANGDIVDVDSAMHMFHYTGADAVMIGRGSVGNPWIFQRVQAALVDGKILPPPTFDEVRSVYLEHANGLFECFKSKHAFRFARKYAFYYFSRYIDSEWRKKFAKTNNLDQIREYIDQLEFVEPLYHDQAPLRALREG